MNAIPIPNPADVERIRSIPDPIIRNLQITQCYYELSAALSGWLGLEANWCTFATWASKQAGQTIRKEDFARLLERRLLYSPPAVQASQQVIAAANIPAGRQSALPENLALSADTLTAAIDRASDAVARGNRKVFEEIGDAFARFLHGCLAQPPDRMQQVEAQRLDGFCEALRAGDPPDGQGYLRQAFNHYARALAEADPKTRAELILLANIEIGFHEQTRLQPEIAESLDAGMLSFLEFARPLFRALFPANGLFHLGYLYLMRLLGRPTDLDAAIQALLAEVRVQVRQAITEIMMSISLPSGVVRLGQDLSADFPEALKQIANPELAGFLEKYDQSPGSLSGSGALDWADLPDRLNFILDLFRCYQEQADLFEPPFTPEQVEDFNSGKVPAGRL